MRQPSLLHPHTVLCSVCEMLARCRARADQLLQESAGWVGCVLGVSWVVMRFIKAMASVRPLGH